MNGLKHSHGKQTDNARTTAANISYPQAGFRHFVERIRQLADEMQLFAGSSVVKIRPCV